MQTPSLVAVRKIQANSSASSFPHEAIESMAHQILASGALVTPLLVKRTGLESFELKSGDFAFHAAARARELDPFNAEMVLAFILDGAEAEPMLRQAAVFGRAAERDGAQTPTSDLGARLGNFERRMEQLVNDLGQRMSGETQTIRQATETLAERMPRPAEPLVILNHASERELLERLAKSGIKGKTASTLVAGVLTARPLESFVDALRVKGLGAKRFAQLIDACAIPTASAGYKPLERGTLVTVS